MKARTLIVTTGALAALVAGTVQPAGAKVASACAAKTQTAIVGYDGHGWSYPLTVIAKKVVVGNGTKAPYDVLVPRLKQSAAHGACGTTTASPQVVDGGSTSSSPHRCWDPGYVIDGILGCALASED
jgi:hypothetical protein